AGYDLHAPSPLPTNERGVDEPYGFERFYEGLHIEAKTHAKVSRLPIDLSGIKQDRLPAYYLLNVHGPLPKGLELNTPKYGCKPPFQSDLCRCSQEIAFAG
ncbi:hypothetical protein ACFL9T_04880, partial [Thermodesulfobacteriota bacterium]